MRLLPIYFDALEKTFTDAEKTIGGSTDLFYRLGDKTLRLRFLSRDLIPTITTALAHLAASPTDHPDIDVRLWDNTIGPSAMPPSLIWSGNSPLQGYLDDGRIDLHCEFWPHRISAFDGEKNLAYYWTEDPKQVFWEDRAAPLRMILSGWASRHQRQVLHAGAVGTPAGGVLLGGKGGAGKSWTALSCLGSKLSFAGDDYCMVSSHPVPQAYCLYSSANLHKIEDMANFPHLSPLVANRDRLDKEKVVLHLHPRYKNEIILSFPLKAILLVQVSSDPGVKIEKTDKQSAVREIFNSSARPKTGNELKSFYSFYQLVNRLPCYVLKVGKDLSKIPDAIYNFLFAGLP